MSGNADLLLRKRRRTRKDVIEQTRKVAIVKSEETSEEKERNRIEWREQVKAELEKTKQLFEEKQRLLAFEQEEARKRAIEEAIRQAAEAEAKRIADEEAAHLAAIEEANRIAAEEEAKRIKKEEEEEIARKKAIEEAEREAELERIRIRKAELEAIKEADEREKRKFEEKMQKRIEEERKKLIAFEESKKREKEKLKKKQEEQEAAKRALVEQQKKALEDEIRRQAEEKAKKIAEEREKRKQKQEVKLVTIYNADTKERQMMLTRKQAEEEAKQKAVEDAKQKKIEEAQRRLDQEAQQSEEKIRNKEENEARKKWEDEMKRKADEEAQRKLLEDTERLAKELEERKIKDDQEQKALEEYIKFAQEEAQKVEMRKKEKEEIKKAVEREKLRKKEEEERQKIQEETRFKAEQAALERERIRKKAFEEAERRAIEEYAKKVEERRKAAEETNRLEEDARRQKIIWRGELQESLERVKKEYDEKLRKKSEEESLIKKQKKKQASLERITEDGFIETEDKPKRRPKRQKRNKTDDELRVENFLKEQEMKRLIASSLDRAKQRFEEKRKERSIEESLIKQKENLEQRKADQEKLRIQQEKDRLLNKIEEAKREIENLKSKDLAPEVEEKLRAIWNSNLEESLETTRQLYESQRQAEDDNKKLAAELIQLDSQDLQNLNNEIEKLEQFQNDLEQNKIAEPTTQDLMQKNEELKAYESYFNKFLDVDEKLEEEKNKEEVKQIVEEEREAKKLEDKIKAYDADQKLKHKNEHKMETISEEEAILNAEIEIDRKQLELTKQKVEIQKEKLKKKNDDKLRKEKELKASLEEARRRDRETIKRQIEIDNELRDAEEAARRWAIEAKRKKDLEFKIKKIVDERQRRKQVKDARVQATLVRTKKLSDKAEKPPQPKRYNPRDASTKLAEFIHKFIYEKDKNTKKVAEDTVRTKQEEEAKQKANEQAKRKAEADAKIKQVIDNKRKKIEENKLRLKEAEHKRKEDLWQAHKRDRERLRKKADEETKHREEDDKKRRKAAEDHKKKLLLEQADKIAQERLKFKKLTSYDFEFDFKPEKKTKSSIEIRQKKIIINKEPTKIKKIQNNLAKSETINDLSKDTAKSLAQALHGYIIGKDFTERRKKDAKIIGHKTLEIDELARKNYKEEQELREAAELARKKEVEEKRKRRLEEEDKSKALDEAKKIAFEASKKKLEEEKHLQEIADKAIRNAREKSELKMKKRQEEELKMKSAIEKLAKKNREKFKQEEEIELEIKESEEAAKKWAIEEEERLQAKKRAKKIAEQRIKKQAKLNAKMQIYYDAYLSAEQRDKTLNDLKSSQTTNKNTARDQIVESTLKEETDLFEHQIQPIKENEPFQSLAEQFHEFIESNEDFNNKKQDLHKTSNIKETKDGKIVLNAEKTDFLSHEFHDFIGSKEDFASKQKLQEREHETINNFMNKPAEKKNLDNKIDNLASLLHKHITSNSTENEPKNTQTIQKSDPQIKKNKSLKLKDEKIHQERAKILMLHEIIKKSQQNKKQPEAKKPAKKGDTLDIKIIDVQKPDDDNNLKISNLSTMLHHLIESKENQKLVDAPTLKSEDLKLIHLRTRKEDRSISRKEITLLDDQQDNPEVYNKKIQNLTLMLHDLINDSSDARANRDKMKSRTIEEAQRSKSLAASRLDKKDPDILISNRANIEVVDQRSEELKAFELARNLKKEEEDNKKTEEETKVKLAIEETRRRDREKLKREQQLAAEQHKAEEEARIWKNLEANRIEDEERVAKIAEQRAIRKSKIESRLQTYHKKYLINKKVKTKLKNKSGESFSQQSKKEQEITFETRDITNTNDSTKQDKLAEKFHDFIESKEDFSSLLKVVKENSEMNRHKLNSIDDLPKLDGTNTTISTTVPTTTFVTKSIEQLDLSKISSSEPQERTNNLAALFHEYIERSLNAEFSLEANPRLGKNETSTPKDTSVDETRTSDETTVTKSRSHRSEIKDKKAIVKNSIVSLNDKSKTPDKSALSSPRKQQTNIKSKTSDKMTKNVIVTSPSNLKSNTDGFINLNKQKNEDETENYVDNLAQLIHNFIETCEKPEANSDRSQKTTNKNFDDILIQGEAIRKVHSPKRTPQELNKPNEQKIEESSPKDTLDDDTLEKGFEMDDDFWQHRINSAEDEARREAVKSAEAAKMRLVRERTERRIDEERARQKAIDEAAINSPFLLRRRAGAYGIKQLSKYTND